MSMVDNTPTSIHGPDSVATPMGAYTPPGPQTPAPTPTPSPEPTPVTAPTSSTADRLQAAANAGGKLSPSAIYGVAATTPTSAKAASVAYFTNALNEATKIAGQLSQLTTNQQLTLWDKAPEALRSLLGAANYRPPAMSEVPHPGHPPGILRDIWAGVDTAWHGLEVGSLAVQNALSTGGQWLNDAMGPAARPVNDFINAPWNVGGAAVSHVLRATLSNAQQGSINALQGGATSGWTGSSVLNIFDIAHIVNSWNETMNGATSYQPEALLYVQKVMGITGPTLRLAKAAASGMSLKQILATVPASQRTAAYGLIRSAGKFQDAVQLLQDSHLTLGQSVFGGLSPAQMHALFPRTSMRSLELTALAAQGVMVAGTAAMALRNPSEAGALAEDASLMERLSAAARTARSATLLGAAGAMGAGSLYAAATGQTADQATAISPFGMHVNPLSGITDGLVQWYLNPLQIAMTSRATIKYHDALAALEALKDPREAEALYANSGKYNRWARKFVEAVTTPWREGAATDVLNADETGLAKSPNIAHLTDVGIPMEGMSEVVRAHYAELLAAAKTHDPREIGAAVGRMIGDELSVTNILRGRMSHLYRDTNLMPAVTLPQEAVDRVLGIGKATLSGLRLAPARMSSAEVLARLSSDAVARELLQADSEAPKLGRVARMMRRAVTLTPTGPIDTTDIHSIANLRNVLLYALPRDRVNDIVNLYENAGMEAEGRRALIAQAGILEMLRVALENGGPGAEKWLEEAQNRMAYGWAEGDGWVNPLNPDGPRLNLAMMGSQLSTRIAVPRFTDVYRLMQRNGVMRALRMPIDAQALDTFMQRYWKPAMLLRPGFAIRVAGEELALFILQNGFSAYARTRAAASLTDAASAQKELTALRGEVKALQDAAALGDTEAANKLDAMHMASAVLDHIPDEALASIDSPHKLLGSIYGWHSVQWMQRNIERTGEISLAAARSMARAIAGDEILRYADDLAKRGVLDNVGAQHILAVAQHADPYSGEIANTTRGMNLLRTEEGLPVQLIKDGVWRVRTHDDPLFLDRWRYALEQIEASKEGRAAARAFSSGGYEGQVQAVEDTLRGRGLWNDLAVALRQQELSPDNEKIAIDVENAQRAVANHEKYLMRFPAAYQTKDGHITLADSEYMNQMFRDWATGIVDHVNRHLFSPIDTYAVPAEEGAPVAEEDLAAHAAAEGRQFPIGARRTNGPRIPFRLEAGDESVPLTPVSHDTAYPRVGSRSTKDSVRLFMPVNTTSIDATRPLNDVATPGRFWTPNYRRAAEIAGGDGSVYAVDVKRGQWASLFESHGAGDMGDAWDRIYAEQHPKPGSPVDPSAQGYFESTARVAYDRVNDRSPNYLIDLIGQGVVPDSSLLRTVPEEAWPETVTTPDHMVKLPSRLERVTSAGFHHMISRPLDWISRQPIFLYNYSVARKQAEAVLAARGIADDSGDLAHDIAMENATRQTGRYIHDPQARSQFAVINRNLAPFWFAQEQFYKRWGRLFGTYPEAYYKLKMAMAGMRNVGFVTNDAYGRPAFVYPFSPEVNRVIGRLPIGVGFTSEIAQLNPSLSQGLAPIPAFAPVISIPTMLAGWLDPRFSAFAQFFQGPNAAPLTQPQGRTMRLLDQVLPTVLARLAEFASTEQFGSPGAGTGPALYLSSLTAAAQMMESTGHGITVADQKDPVKMQAYVNRLSNWTLTMMLTRSLFGMLAPGTPNFAFANSGPGNDLQTLLNDGVNYNDAVAAVMKAYPNATADLIYNTTAMRSDQSGAYIPATQTAGKWINDHVSLFENFPQIAPWAMPADVAKGAFSDPVYQQEMNLGLRARRALYEPGNPNSWYIDYEYSKAANTYYGLEQYVYAAGGAPTKADGADAQAQLNMTQEQAQAALGLSGASAEQVKMTWDEWKQGFMQVNPIFQRYQATKGTESAARRDAVVSQLQSAINAGALPEGSWSTHIQELMSAFDVVQQLYTQTQGNTAYASQRSQAKQAFLTLGTQMAIKYPEIAPFWNGVLSKQVGVVG